MRNLNNVYVPDSLSRHEKSFLIFIFSISRHIRELYIEYSSGRMFGTLNFTEYCEFSVRSDEKYHAVLEEAQRIHSVAWYISMITDDYISLDEELQELEKQREFEADLYSFSS